MRRPRTLIADYVDWLSGAILVIGIVFGFVLMGKIPENERSIVVIITVWGGAASIFGLTIALIQILSLKVASEVAAAAIEDTKNKLILGISISDVTDTISSIREVERNLGNEKYEMAKIKLEAVRDRLIEFKDHHEFRQLLEGPELEEVIKEFNAQLSGELFDQVYVNPKPPYVKSTLSSSLQKVVTVMLEFKQKIKYQTA